MHGTVLWEDKVKRLAPNLLILAQLAFSSVADCEVDMRQITREQQLAIPEASSEPCADCLYGYSREEMLLGIEWNARFRDELAFSFIMGGQVHRQNGKSGVSVTITKNDAQGFEVRTEFTDGLAFEREIVAFEPRGDAVRIKWSLETNSECGDFLLRTRFPRNVVYNTVVDCANEAELEPSSGIQAYQLMERPSTLGGFYIAYMRMAGEPIEWASWEEVSEALGGKNGAGAPGVRDFSYTFEGEVRHHALVVNANGYVAKCASIEAPANAP